MNAKTYNSLNRRLAGQKKNPVRQPKLYTEYRDNITSILPVYGRKYTMTHSDSTGDRYVTIGRSYAEDKVSEFRDEVRLEWKKDRNRPVLVGSVLISSAGEDWDAAKRYEIFMREMPVALKAIRMADEALFQKIPDLDETSVRIYFQAQQPAFRGWKEFGKIGDYRPGIKEN